MDINPNFNGNANTQIEHNIINNVVITPQESNFVIESINYANSCILSRNIQFAQTTISQTVELTPKEFIIALYNGKLPNATIMVNGDLTFKNNDINYLPSNLIIQGELQIENCTNLTKIPSRLEVNDLSIINCNNLTSLADDIVIHNILKLKECNNLGKLQQNLTIEELSVVNCAKVELSSDITVNKMLIIASCPKITNLPLNYQDVTHISLFNLHNLKLPDNFYTSGTLDICSCNIDLPENMTIKRDLLLDSCDYIKSLPSNITIYGNIDISNCYNITYLPSFWFTNIPDNLPFYNPNDNRHHYISLINTGIPELDIDNYSWELPNNIYIIDNIIDAFELEYLINLWLQDAGCTYTINLTNLSTNEKEDIITFLYGLTRTKEYKNYASTNYLANRVVNILKLIATDNNLREKILFIIHDAVSTCEDRILLSLAEIEFLPLLQQAEQQSITDRQGTLLKNLGKQQLYADEIQNHAITQAEIVGAEKEEIEFILSYKIQLASAFNLSFPKITMNYNRIPNLTDNDIKFAHTLITMKVTNSYFEQWLESWAPWQRHKRRWQLKQYNQLKAKIMTNAELQVQGSCIISGKSIEEITDLVSYHNNIYSYESLCKWYILKGMNPLITNETLILNNIFAVRIDESNADESYKKIKLDDNI